MLSDENWSRRKSQGLQCNGCSNSYNVDWQKANPKNRMVAQAKHRAKLKGVPFSITVSDIVIPDVCPALGISIARSTGRASDDSPSLDRIVPELGYVPGNIAVISHRANRLKNDATLEEIKRLYEWMQQL
jgi:hypothetical protein